ncbi:hypothetical protein IHE44_0010940, partial [Lamprotornis superbus]
RWGSTGGGWQQGSGAVWPWPGLCSGVRPSSSSTRHWMMETRGRHSAGCALGWPRPYWSCPTGRGCWTLPIASWCWSTEPWWRLELQPSSGNAAGLTAACCSVEAALRPPGWAARRRLHLAGNKGELAPVSPFLVFVSPASESLIPTSSGSQLGPCVPQVCPFPGSLCPPDPSLYPPCTDHLYPSPTVSL